MSEVIIEAFFVIYTEIRRRSKCLTHQVLRVAPLVYSVIRTGSVGRRVVVAVALFRILRHTATVASLTVRKASIQHKTRPILAPRAPVDWAQGELLGSGSFGHVYLCYDRDSGADLAVKRVMLQMDKDNKV